MIRFGSSKTSGVADLLCILFLHLYIYMIYIKLHVYIYVFIYIDIDTSNGTKTYPNPLAKNPSAAHGAQVVWFDVRFDASESVQWNWSEFGALTVDGSEIRQSPPGAKSLKIMGS